MLQHTKFGSSRQRRGFDSYSLVGKVRVPSPVSSPFKKAHWHRRHWANLLKPNSSTLSGSNQLRTSYSVMEFGFYYSHMKFLNGHCSTVHNCRRKNVNLRVQFSSVRQRERRCKLICKHAHSKSPWVKWAGATISTNGAASLITRMRGSAIRSVRSQW